MLNRLQNVRNVLCGFNVGNYAKNFSTKKLVSFMHHQVYEPTQRLKKKEDKEPLSVSRIIQDVKSIDT